jgi:hypothetical protein
VLPLAALVIRLRQVVVAGLVSGIDVVGRPDLLRQVAVFNPLPDEKL